MLRGVAWVAAASLPLVMCNSLSASAGESDRWSGGYIGAHVGGAWGDVSVKDIDGGVDPGPFKYSSSGAFGGGTAGYNWQFDSIVLGIEGDLGYLGLQGDSKIASSDPAYHQDLTLDGGLYGDITGRAGIAVGDTLIYGKGGFAFFDGEANQASTKPWYQATGTGTFSGWVAGGGIEHFVTPNISIKAEYLHFDFGSEGGFQEKISPSLPAPDDGTLIGTRFHNVQSLTADSVKVGIAFHF
jgi:outer membrane immunogenic protein